MEIKINVVKEEIAVKKEAEIEKRGRIDEEKKKKKRLRKENWEKYYSEKIKIK